MNNKSVVSLTLQDGAVMIPLMEKTRVDLKIKVAPEIRDALRLESALSGRDMAVIIEDFVKTQLADALAQIRARRAKREKNAKKDSPLTAASSFSCPSSPSI